MRPPKRIDRSPGRAQTRTHAAQPFRKGRRFQAPDDAEIVDVTLDRDEVAALPTAGEAPSKWEMRTGRLDPVVPIVDLRHREEATIDLRPSVRIVEGSYYERRSAGFKSRA